MSKEVEWKEKKTSLGNAVVLSVVMLVAGLFVGANWQQWFGGFAPYLGLDAQVESNIDWSKLNEVYNKLQTSYNGEISEYEVIEGAK